MRIILLRHGQTDLNVQKRLQGSSEIPLNDRGRQQARQTHDLLVELGLIPDKIISSPLGRAIETACLAAGIKVDLPDGVELVETNAPKEIEVDENLIEMAFGIYEQQNMNEVNPAFLHECFDHPEGYKPPEQGECYDDVVARAKNVIENLRQRINAGEFSKDAIIMLVSHGALSHGIFEYIKNTPRSAYWDVDFNNCAIAELFISTDGKSDDYIFLSDGFEKNW